MIRDLWIDGSCQPLLCLTLPYLALPRPLCPSTIVFTPPPYIIPQSNQDAIVWSIKQFHGQREYLMRAHFGLPSISAEGAAPESWKAPVEVKFEIPYFTVSGIQVRYLKIIEKSGYQALPWVRYITQNGDYQLRMT